MDIQTSANKANEVFDNIYTNHKALTFACFAIGAFTVSKYALRALRGIWKTFLRPGKDLYKRYQGGYAVVTGATFGLGLEYASQLAQRGFNIVLVSRNQDKLNSTRQDILKINSEVDVKTIQFDFNVPYSPENYESLEKSLNELTDVSILINNVGAVARGLMHEISMEDINTLIQVNWLAQAFMSRILLPKMIKRSQEENKKCAIINISSVAVRTQLQGMAMYASTKTYNKCLSEVIEKEVGKDIDVLTVMPGPTLTNMIKTKIIYVITPQQHVSSVLSHLGHDKVSYGHYHHWMYVQSWKFSFFRTYFWSQMQKSAK